MRRIARRRRRPLNWRIRRGGWKGRNEIAIRLATLMRIAGSRRWMPRVQDLADELDVHPRTVKRDLAALEAAGVVLPLEGEARAVSLVAQFSEGGS